MGQGEVGGCLVLVLKVLNKQSLTKTY